MKQGSKIGIVCCSNGLRPEQAETIKMLVQILEKSGLEVDLSPYLYGDENGQAGTARERAGALMKFYEDDSVTDIFDVSVDYLIGYSSYAHKVEEVSETALNEDELTFLKKYRSINPSSRALVQQFMDEFLRLSGE